MVFCQNLPRDSVSSKSPSLHVAFTVVANFLVTMKGILVLTCDVANSANEVHAHGNIT